MAEAEAKGFMFIFDGWFCLTCTTFDEGYKTKLDPSVYEIRVVRYNESNDKINCYCMCFT